MQIHQLRYFCAVAKAGSFTRAAEHERIAQPSLSQQVRKLEDEPGARLFDRLGRTVRLTSFGRTFLPRADAIPREVDDAKHEIEEMAGLERGRIAVGAIPLRFKLHQYRRQAKFRQAVPEREPRSFPEQVSLKKIVSEESRCQN